MSDNSIRMPIGILLCMTFWLIGWNSSIYVLAGTSLLLIGGLSNFIVICSNGWKMPVRLVEGGSVVNTGRHASLSESTRYPFLGDYMRMGFLDKLYYLSIGDVLIVAGAVGIVVAV